MHTLRLLAITLLLLGLAACGGADPRPPATARSGPPVVAVTFAPLQYVAERLGAGLVKIVAPVPADADPSFWTPTPEAIAVFQTADLVLANGAQFERWLDVVSLPRARLVKTTARIPESLIRVEGGAVHSHGKGGAHSHAGLNGHTWVDPSNMRVQATAVRDALARLLPEEAEVLTARHMALDADLAALAQGYADLPPLADGEVLVASHPAYDYLARRLGWTMVNLDWVPEVVPTTEALDGLAARLKGHSARFLLWEAQPLPAAAEAVRTRAGLASVVVTPGERLLPEDRAAGRDWLAVMQGNLARLRDALASR